MLREFHAPTLSHPPLCRARPRRLRRPPGLPRLVKYARSTSGTAASTTRCSRRSSSPRATPTTRDPRSAQGLGAAPRVCHHRRARRRRPPRRRLHSQPGKLAGASRSSSRTCSTWDTRRADRGRVAARPRGHAALRRRRPGPRRHRARRPPHARRLRARTLAPRPRALMGVAVATAVAGVGVSALVGRHLVDPRRGGQPEGGGASRTASSSSRSSPARSSPTPRRRAPAARRRSAPSPCRRTASTPPSCR